MRDNSANEKLYLAVSALATGTGTIQDRLTEAFAFNLSLLKQDDGPNDLMRKIFDLTARMTRQSAKGEEGTVAATAAILSDQEAMEIAADVLSLYIESEQWEQSRADEIFDPSNQTSHGEENI